MLSTTAVITASVISKARIGIGVPRLLACSAGTTGLVAVGGALGRDVLAFRTNGPRVTAVLVGVGGEGAPFDEGAVDVFCIGGFYWSNNVNNLFVIRAHFPIPNEVVGWVGVIDSPIGVALKKVSIEITLLGRFLFGTVEENLTRSRESKIIINIGVVIHVLADLSAIVAAVINQE